MHTHTHFRGEAVRAHRGAVFQDQVTCVNSPVGVDGGSTDREPVSCAKGQIRTATFARPWGSFSHLKCENTYIYIYICIYKHRGSRF